MTRFRALVVALLALTITVPAAVGQRPDRPKDPRDRKQQLIEKREAAQKKAKRRNKKKAFKVSRGSVSLTFEAAFVQKLGGLGVLPTAIAPGELDAGTLTLTLPIGSGSVNKSGRKATFKLRGGQNLTQFQTQVTRTITNLKVKVNGKRVTVTGDAGNGTSVVLPGAPFLSGTATRKKTNRKYSLTVTRLELTPEAAADLNGQFANSQPVFAAGELVGTGKGTARK